MISGGDELFEHHRDIQKFRLKFSVRLIKWLEADQQRRTIEHETLKHQTINYAYDLNGFKLSRHFRAKKSFSKMLRNAFIQTVRKRNALRLSKCFEKPIRFYSKRISSF